MTQLHVRNVLDVYPPNSKLSLPLVLQPHTRVRVVVDGTHHPRHPAEMPAPVDREEQVDHATLLFSLAVSGVKSLVSMLGTAPDLVLDAAVDVVLRVRLYHEEAGQGRRQIELLRIIIVLNSQLVEKRVG